LILLRVGVFALAVLLAAARMLPPMIPVAVAAFVSVPAHLPILIGHRRVTWLPLVGRVPLALLMHEGVVLPEGAVAVAVLYFAPTIAYGLLATAVYSRALPRTEPVALLAGSTVFLGMRTVLVVAASNQIQASTVQQLVSTSATIAFVDRLIRSAFSFVFPHLVRTGTLGSWRQNSWLPAAAAVGALTLTAAGATLSPALVMAPVSWDIYNTMFAGRSVLSDLAVLLGALWPRLRDLISA
jgi:hypothetical protein